MSESSTFQMEIRLIVVEIYICTVGLALACMQLGVKASVPQATAYMDHYSANWADLDQDHEDAAATLNLPF